MAHTITAPANYCQVSGVYKEFVSNTGSTDTVIQFKSGEAPASGDAGRFIAWRPGNTAITGLWRIKRIASATATTVTLVEALDGAPAEDDIIRISTTFADIVAALTSAEITLVGANVTLLNRSIKLVSSAFLAGTNLNISVSNNANGVMNDLGLGCILQLGELIGGEGGASTKTINGCSFSIVNNYTGSRSSISAAVSQQTNGPIYNLYGCKVLSSVLDPGYWMFQRMGGPARFIGCDFDGPIGGRWLNVYTELADCRFSGNNTVTVSWGPAATFLRDIDNCFFYNGLAALKTFEGFSGTVKNTRFDLSSLTDVITMQGTGGGVTLIDSTTFTDGFILDGGNGTIQQIKTINYTIADSSGTLQENALVAVYDNTNAIQTGIQTSNVSGVVDEIYARFSVWTDANPSVDKTPFTIRIRKYGFIYLDFTSSVSDAIRQQVRLLADPQITETNVVTVAAYTGIAVDFSAGTIAVTVAHTTEEIYDYVRYSSALSANMQYADSITKSGGVLDISDYDLTVTGVQITGNVTTTGTITLASGGTIAGVYTDTDGTNLPYSITGIDNTDTATRLQVYNVTEDAEVLNLDATGMTSVTGSYVEGVGINSGDVLRIRVAAYDGVTAKEEYETTLTASSSGWSVTVSQSANTIYDTIGIDGATVTKFTADFVNDEFDLVTATDFTGVELYARYIYTLASEDGIRQFFGGIVAEDIANYRVVTAKLDAYFNNNTATNVIQTDNVRIYRDDDQYPVRNPTTGSGGIDVVWRGKVYIANVGGSALTPTESAALANILSNTDRVDGLIEDSSGDRFTAKALETAAGSGGDATEANQIAIAAAIDALNDFNPATDTVAHVTLVDTTTTNTDMVSSPLDSTATQAAAAAALVAYDPPTKAELDAAEAAIQIDIATIPTNPLLDDDARLDNLDAPISDTSTFNPATDTVAHVALVDVTTTNTDILDSTAVEAAALAALTSYDPPTKAELDTAQAAIQSDVGNIPTNPVLDDDVRLDNIGDATAANQAIIAADIAALNDFNPATDTVAHVTLVDTTTTNTDMATPLDATATEAATLAALVSYDGPTKTEMDDALAILASDIAGVQTVSDALQFLAEADHFYDHANGLLHYYEKGTTTDLIPPKTVTGTSQAQNSSVVE